MVVLVAPTKIFAFFFLLNIQKLKIEKRREIERERHRHLPKDHSSRKKKVCFLSLTIWKLELLVCLARHNQTYFSLWFVNIVEKYWILKCQNSWICCFLFFLSNELISRAKSKGSNECVLLLVLLVRIFSCFFIASSTQVLRVLDSTLDATRSTVPPFHLLHQIWVSQICYLKLIGGFSESLLLVLPFCLSIVFIDAALLLIYSSKSFLLLNFLLSIDSYMLYLDFYIGITDCWCIFIFLD
jgi:hypothetical protein